MKTNACTDPGVGKFLPDYELHALTEAELESFELHVMNCDYCAVELEQFHSIARLLTKDSEVHKTITSLDQQPRVESTLWSLIRDALWPDTSFFLRPAVSYTAIVVLIALWLRVPLSDKSLPRIAVVETTSISYRSISTPVDLNTTDVILLSAWIPSNYDRDSIDWRLDRVGTSAELGVGTLPILPSRQVRLSISAATTPPGLYELTLGSQEDDSLSVASLTFRTIR